MATDKKNEISNPSTLQTAPVRPLEKLLQPSNVPGVLDIAILYPWWIQSLSQKHMNMMKWNLLLILLSCFVAFDTFRFGTFGIQTHWLLLPCLVGLIIWTDCIVQYVHVFLNCSHLVIYFCTIVNWDDVQLFCDLLVRLMGRHIETCIRLEGDGSEIWAVDSIPINYFNVLMIYQAEWLRNIFNLIPWCLEYGVRKRSFHSNHLDYGNWWG